MSAHPDHRSTALDLLWLASGTVLVRSDWALQSLYHSNFSGAQVAGALLSLAALTAAAGGAVVLAGGAVGRAAVRTAVLLLAAYQFQGLLRAAGLFGQTPMAASEKALLLGLLIAAAALATWLIAAPMWQRVRAALAVSSLIYCLSPLVIAAAMAPTRSIDLLALDILAGNPAPGGPVIVVLLDELAADHAEQVVERLQAAGAVVSMRTVASAGRDTIDVVPQMLGAGPIDEVRVCTTTALCTPQAVFDFRRVHLKSSVPVHIVGMFHPYCSMQGLASCVHDDNTGQSPIASLLCTFARLVPADGLRCDPLDAGRWAVFRERVIGAVERSAFWTSGGALFAHVPLPHPPGPVVGPTLKVDYEAGVKRAAEFTAQLWTRARERFGPETRLIVVSDHSLRTAMWCKTKAYVSSGCEVPASWSDGRVPLIAASGRELTIAVSNTNAGVLASGLRAMR